MPVAMRAHKLYLMYSDRYDTCRTKETTARNTESAAPFLEASQGKLPLEKGHKSRITSTHTSSSYALS